MASKFNVSKDKTRRTFAGIIFDSELEMKYYRDFVLPKIESGEILNCERQIPFELQCGYKHKKSDGSNETVRAIVYKADFVLTLSDGQKQIIDTKGMADPTALLKRKMFWYKYPDLDYRWISYSKKDGGWIEYDALKKMRSARRKQKNK